VCDIKYKFHDNLHPYLKYVFDVVNSNKIQRKVISDSVQCVVFSVSAFAINEHQARRSMQMKRKFYRSNEIAYLSHIFNKFLLNA